MGPTMTTPAPTMTPTSNPTLTPTAKPTLAPTATPTSTPTASPTMTPTMTPTMQPTLSPSIQPTPYCVDSPLQVVLNGIITTCPFATPSDCERESLASTCPYTCGTCQEWA